MPARCRRAGGGAADGGKRRLRLDQGRASRLSLLATAERLFCPACGTQLALRDEPDHLDVTLASLDDPAAVRPRAHIWTTSRIGWFEIADDLPRYAERRADVSS